MSVYCYECMKPNLPDGIRSCPDCGARIPYEAQDLRDCPPGTVLNGRYLLGKAIGHGGFGVTYIALDLKTSQRVCIKEYNPKYFSHRKPSNMAMLLPDDGDEAFENYHKYKQGLLDEAKRLIELRSVPGVVRCFESFECNNTAYMVLEYLEGSDLKQYVLRNGGPRNPPGVVEGVQMTCEVLRILSAVHKHKLLHRDISPDNVFLANGMVKLIDFGSARNTYVEEMTGFNKAGYAAPEMVNGGKEGPYTDLYSVGGVLYFLLMGEKPTKLSGTDRLNAPSPVRSTPELTIVFNRATDPQPEARYQSAEVMLQDLMYCLQQFDGSSLPSNQPSKRFGGLVHGLLIATLSVTAAGLIGLIVMVGLQDSSEPSERESVQSSSATAIVANTTAPLAMTSPEAAVTPVPTLVTALQERYVMLAGTTAQLEVEFSDGQSYDLDLRVIDGESVTVGGGEISAVRTGTSKVEYSVFGEARSFTVEVVAWPEMTAVSEQNESLYMDPPFSQGGSYTVNVPKGDKFEAALSKMPQGVTWELVCLQGEDGMVALSGERLIIWGYQEQSARYAIRLNGIFAQEQPELLLDVTVSGHVIAAKIKTDHTMLVGSKYPIEFVLSDGAAIDLEKDIENSSSLVVQVNSTDPGVLDFSCNEVGEHSIKICETSLHFNVVEVSLQENAEQLERMENGYRITVPVQMELPLTLTGVGSEQKLTVENGNHVVSAVCEDGNKGLLLKAGNETGERTLTICCDGETLFKLEVKVVSDGLKADIQSKYIVFTDSAPLVFDLEYEHGLDADPKLTCTADGIVDAVVSEGGRRLTVTPVGVGGTTVTVGDKSFHVDVLPDNVGLAMNDSRLERDGDNYTLTMLDTDEISLRVVNYPQSYQIVCNKLSGQVAETFTIGAVDSGSREVYTFRSEGTDDDRELFRLTVESNFAKKLETRLNGEAYCILDGSVLCIDLDFRDGQTFQLETSFDENVVKVTQGDDGRTLVISAVAPGLTQVIVDGQTFFVTVAAADVRPVDTDGDMVEKTGGNAYLVRVDEGMTLTIPLENAPELYTLDCASHDACDVVVDGNELRITGREAGIFSHEICAIGTDDGGRMLFGIKVEVVSPTPVPATPTPVPATPTPVPVTPTPAPLYRLEQGPEENYQLFPGQTKDVPLVYGSGGIYDLEIICSGTAVSVSQPHEGALRIAADHEGEAVVHYTSDDKRCSFTVSVMAMPEMALQNETDYRYINKIGGDYVLDMPLGDSAALLLTGPEGFAFEVVPEKAGQGATITSAEGELTVAAKVEGEYGYSIRPVNSDEVLYRLRVNVTGRVVTSGLETKEYTLLTGKEIPIELTFSDGEPVEDSEIGVAPAGKLIIDRDPANPNRLIVEGVSSGHANVKICGEYISFTILETPQMAKNELVTQVSSNYTVKLPVNRMISLPLENSDERHSYTCKPAVSGGVEVKASEDGKSLIVTAGGTIGSTTYEVFDHGILIFCLQVDVVSADVTNKLENRVMFEGESHTWKLEYAHDMSAEPEITTSRSGVVDVSLSGDGRELTVKALEVNGEEATEKISVGGQSFNVTVCNDDVGIKEQSGLSNANGTYVLEMNDNDPAVTLQLSGVSDAYGLRVISSSDAAAEVAVFGNTLVIHPRKEGTSVFTIRTEGLNSERDLLEVKVVVNFGRKLTGEFADCTLLEGATKEIPLEFRGGVAFDVEESSSNPNVVSVSVKNGKLVLNCREAGKATITLAGKNFIVTVAELVGITGSGITGPDDSGSYNLSLRAGQNAQLRLKEKSDGYEMYITGPDGKKTQLSNSSVWKNTFTAAGSFSYTLTAAGKDFSVTVGTLNVTVREPILTTQFKSSYTIMLGQQYYIDLSSEGSMPDLTTSVDGDASAVQIKQENSRLYFTGEKVGAWAVVVSDGTKEQNFTVKVAEAEDVLSLSGTALEKNASGHYVLNLIPGYDVQLQLNMPVDCTDPSLMTNTVLDNACTASWNNGGVHLCPKEELPTGGQLVIKACHQTDGMTMVNTDFALATIDVCIERVWMISSDSIDLRGEEMVPVMRNVLGALKGLRLWSGAFESTAAKKMASKGQVDENVWKAMEKVREMCDGFSGQPYYTREDYLRLIELGELGKQISKAEDALEKGLSTAMKDMKNYWERRAAASGRVNKATFAIEQAAYGDGRLYLLDTDGYLITYNLDTNSTEAVDAEFRYKLLSGNGWGVVAVNENDTIRTFGLDEDLAGSLESIETDVSKIVLTDEAALLVLGPAGYYSITGNRDMPGTTLTEGQALYVTGDEVIIAAGMGGKNLVASNVRLVAAGDSVLAFVGGTRADMQKLYVHYDETDVPLLKKMGHGTDTQHYVFQNVTRTISGNTLYKNVKSIAVSENAVAAVWSDGKTDGKVFMFGENANGQLGVGNNTSATYFRLVKTSDGSDLTGVKQVVLLNDHSLFLDNSGRIWIAGSYSGGTSNTARRLSGLEGVKQLIRLDETRALAINSGGDICVLEDGEPTGPFFAVTNLPVQ